MTPAPDDTPLTFDPETHTYTLDDLTVPSVTEVLRGAGLIAGSAYADTRALARGTAVHSACHYLDEGDLDEASVSREIEPYVRAYRRFLADSGFKVGEIERRVWSRLHGFAGTLDRTGELCGRQVLFDIKSGPAEEWHSAQLGGYAIALAESCGLRVVSRFCLHLAADGKFSIREYHAPDSHRQFLAALAAWRQHGHCNSGLAASRT